MNFGRKRNAFLAVALAFGTTITGCESLEPRSGQELFQAVVQSPIPTSVEVLHSQDEVPLFDPAIWLHFTIDAEVYEQIQSQYPWERSTGDGKSNMPGPVVQWWKPEKLENVSRYQVYTEDCRCTKQLWINGSHEEAFFKVSF
ncbi:MAG: hypothetical protein ACFB0D_05540 [Phormidesmis sp.]